MIPFSSDVFCCKPRQFRFRIRKFVLGGKGRSSEFLVPLVLWEFELPLDEFVDMLDDAAFGFVRFGVLALSGLLKVLVVLLSLGFGEGMEFEVRSSQLLDVEGA